MAFASEKKRGTRAVSRTASRPAAKTDEQTEKEGAESTETPSASFENSYTRRVYGWYEQEKEKRADAPLLLVTVMLLAIGLIALLSASYPKAYYSSSTGPFYYFIRQTMFAAVGLALMYVVSCIPYWKYKRWALHLYVLSIILADWSF